MKTNLRNASILTCCPFCGEYHEIFVSESDWFDWKFGDALAQDAFPYLSADEREMLISGVCPKCWEKTFSGIEDEDDFDEQYDFEEEDNSLEVDDFDECGFNPYMGCYDYDC